MVFPKPNMPSFRWLIQLSSAYFVVMMILMITSLPIVHCIHIDGIWSPSSMLKVLTRFGFQKTDQNHRWETSGYIYGNISLLNHKYSRNPIFHSGVLLLANKALFKQIFALYLKMKSNNFVPNTSQNNDLEWKDQFCRQIFRTIRDDNFDPKCNTSAKNNSFIRYIPCPVDMTCNEPYQEMNLPNYQLTYVVDGQKDASFWYILMLPCARIVHKNSSCDWINVSNMKTLLSYDLWAVNGHPNIVSNRIIDFSHQFSCEQQNLWIYIFLTISYIILMIIQTYSLSRQKSKTLIALFTISLLFHTLSFFFTCLHKIVFAHNGKGFETLFTIAEIMKIMSTALLMLFVLIIAKGWPFTKPEIFSKTMLIILATIYIIIKILLYIWTKNSLNWVEEVDEYHTVPGWISLGFRVMLMFWFIYELRHTMRLEQDTKKLKFYLHFGAGMLVWFIHLPLVTLVAIHIDLMWRFKIITGFSSIADFMAYAILTKILWNTFSKKFLTTGLDFNEELEYYDDSAHSETYKFSNANNRSKHLYDNHVCDKTITT